MKSLLVAALLVVGSMAASQAQIPAPLAISLGTQTDSASNTTYSISTSGHSDQNRQEVQFRITTEGKTSVVTLLTGRQKTVGQVTSLIAKVFQKFLAGQPANTFLGKLGSLEKGGEVVFIAESPDTLLFNFSNPDQPLLSSVFSRADAAAFVALLERK